MKDSLLAVALVALVLWWYSKSRPAASTTQAGSGETASKGVGSTAVHMPGGTDPEVVHPKDAQPPTSFPTTVNGGSPVISVFAADQSEQPQNMITIYNAASDPRYNPTSPQYLLGGSNPDADVENAFAGAGGTGQRVLSPIDQAAIAWGGGIGWKDFGYGDPTVFDTGGHGFK